MIPTFVVIPVRNQLPLTKDVLGLLRCHGGWERIHIYDNGSTDGTLAYLIKTAKNIPGLKVTSAPGWTIHQMWNDGWRRILGLTPSEFNVAFLNNDISFGPGFLQDLGEILRSRDDVWITYPDYTDDPIEGHQVRLTRLTYANGGMSGFAFMVRGELAPDTLPMFDERFKWWFGDTDFAMEVEQRGGRQARVTWQKVIHLESATAKQHPELRPIAAEDAQRFADKRGVTFDFAGRSISPRIEVHP